MIRTAVILALLTSGGWPACSGCCNSAGQDSAGQDSAEQDSAASHLSPSLSACQRCGSRNQHDLQNPQHGRLQDGPPRHRCPDGDGSCPRHIAVPAAADIGNGSQKNSDTKEGALAPALGPACLLASASPSRDGQSVTGQGEGRPVPTPILLCCLLR